MAKILNNTNITNATQKIIETQDGYIINGQYYDKKNIIPKPLKLMPYNGSWMDMSLTKTCNSLNKNISNKAESRQSVIVDNNDSTISYIFNSATSINNVACRKIKEVNNNVEVLYYIDYTSTLGANATISECIGQDDNYLWIMVITNSYNCCIVYRISKSDLTMTVCKSSANYSDYTKIYENDAYIYYTTQCAYGNNYLNRITKTSNLWEDTKTLTLKPSSSIYYLTHCSEPVKIENDIITNYKFIIDGTIPKIFKYTFDFSQASMNNIASEVEANVTWNDMVSSMPVFTTMWRCCYDPFITEENGKKYLSYFVYELSDALNATGIALNLPKYGVYTFLIDNDSLDLTFKSFTQISGGMVAPRGYITINNNKFLVVATNSSLSFYSFNSINETWILTDHNDISMYSFGVDSKENIWALKLDGSVEMFNPTVANSVNLNFENSTYEYDGNDISTYIEIEATSYTGERIASNLQLSIKGDAIFTANGTKIIRISTKTDSKLQVPVKIVGKGNITISPQLIL